MDDVSEGIGVDWLALDVGGANLKAAHQRGQVRTVPFEVWKHPDGLGAALTALAGTFPAFGRIALTMTAELCDCFRTRSEGVLAVLAAVEQAAAGRCVGTWGTDGLFHDVASIRREPTLAAASNWLALAAVAARLIDGRRGLLIDVGSTTTDLIALNCGRVVARGRTDRERLSSRELVYVGVRRTPLCALATELAIGEDGPIGIAAELFATTLDVFLTTGDISEDPGDRSTADGRPATVEAARDRLARMVGDDRENFSTRDALNLARAAEVALVGRLADAARLACASTVGPPEVVVTAGSGEFLARQVARAAFGPGPEQMGLANVWSPSGSTAACACALLRLLEDEPDRPFPGHGGGHD